MRLIGKITQDGKAVEAQDGRVFGLPIRTIGQDGFPEVLIDAQRVGGDAQFRRQSIREWIGFPVEFMSLNGETGFNFEIYPLPQPETADDSSREA
jgi:hypothetical protein